MSHGLTVSRGSVREPTAGLHLRAPRWSAVRSLPLSARRDGQWSGPEGVVA